MEITKRETGGYTVKSGGAIVGMVRKEDAWTVRGSRSFWRAYRKGACLGEFATRQEAAAYLVNRLA
ncbi:hypothetical protein LB521_27555 [Mesorhizobium sp. BR-1-1-8]|uniref:hypothetical protein n=1 Tax=Mesorhizobium sp. BR-1-1-8 TaxID=2876659 RepID=UPI001CCD2193|nr:hypothetical protein [Mesorhizobium sp. BR-1-1-8]MBZ9984893.1 hypothetical protein [Mesorhizobium sp. BR-1-1-8]